MSYSNEFHMLFIKNKLFLLIFKFASKTPNKIIK